MSIHPAAELLSARDWRAMELHARDAEARGQSFKLGSAIRTTQEADRSDPAKEAGDGFFGADGFTFDDFLDIINPLHHIPVVGAIYRSLTGDEISQGARIAGGTLYGGPLGTFTAAASAAIETATGKGPGALAIAALTGEEDTPEAPAPTMLARTDELTAPAEGGAPETMPPLAPASDIPRLGPVPNARADQATLNARNAARAAMPQFTEDEAALILRALGAQPAAGDQRAPGQPNPMVDPVTGAALHPSVAVPEAGVANRMETALDKYRALLEARAAEQARRVDTDL